MFAAPRCASARSPRRGGFDGENRDPLARRRVRGLHRRPRERRLRLQRRTVPERLPLPSRRPLLLRVGAEAGRSTTPATATSTASRVFAEGISRRRPTSASARPRVAWVRATAGAPEPASRTARAGRRAPRTPSATWPPASTASSCRAPSCARVPANHRCALRGQDRVRHEEPVRRSGPVRIPAGSRARRRVRLAVRTRDLLPRRRDVPAHPARRRRHGPRVSRSMRGGHGLLGAQVRGRVRREVLPSDGVHGPLLKTRRTPARSHDRARAGPTRTSSPARVRPAVRSDVAPASVDVQDRRITGVEQR